MSLDDVAKLTFIFFNVFSGLAIGLAVPKYLFSRNHRSGETLLLLESRFTELQSSWKSEWLLESKVQEPITRIIDPEANKYSKSDLAAAIGLVLKKESDKHSPPQNAWMSRLDELLRFLSLVAAMRVNRLLKSRALWDVYYYWYCAIWINPDLRKYVEIYSPVLYEFLVKDKKQIEKYWANIKKQADGSTEDEST